MPQAGVVQRRIPLATARSFSHPLLVLALLGWALMFSSRILSFNVPWRGSPTPILYFILLKDSAKASAPPAPLFASGNALLIICCTHLISHHSPLCICCCYCSFLPLPRFSRAVKRQKQPRVLKEGNNPSVLLTMGICRSSCLCSEYPSKSQRLDQGTQKTLIPREKGRWRTQSGEFFHSGFLQLELLLWFFFPGIERWVWPTWCIWNIKPGIKEAVELFFP